jgi:N-methylhydantoinase A
MQWVGIDVGGTFTDIAVYDETTGSLRLGKVPSVSDDPTQGVLSGLDRVNIDAGQIGRIVHGMTIGTNAILERKGAVVWVITTKGFRDVLEIARTNRTVLYDIRTLKPESIVPRQRMEEVDERLAFDGTELKALATDDVDAAIARCSTTAEAVAVCLLHSYVNPAHEREVAKRVAAALPGTFVCTSSEVLSEYREYERFSTTVLNAYIGPLVNSYLRALSRGLEGRGLTAQLLIMTSSGGVVRPGRAARLPVHTVLSGPAGGVAAALHFGRHLGIGNLITYDMGGTSTDVCLIEALEAPVTTEQFISGLPNRTPQIEINSVGAGGGSIAWADAGPILKVGPRSAGATPGPACYGKGGEEPTVTDANLLLKRMKPDSLLAGEIRLDAERARAAIERLSENWPSLDPLQLADGIVRIAVARMVSAIKEISIAKGYDPRDFSLLAYGGAGPMHAAFIATELEMFRVIIPPGPGNFSAFGSLISDLRHDYVRTRLLDTRRAQAPEVEEVFVGLEDEARRSFEDEGIAPDQIAMQRMVGMRYVGQSWELLVRLPDGPISMPGIEQLFQQAHARRYGHSHAGAAEIVSFRLSAIGQVRKPALHEAKLNGSIHEARLEHRSVYFDGASQSVPVYDRERLPADARLMGPALIEEMGTVTVIPPGWLGSLGDLAEIILERSNT